MEWRNFEEMLNLLILLTSLCLWFHLGHPLNTFLCPFAQLSLSKIISLPMVPDSKRGLLGLRVCRKPPTRSTPLKIISWLLMSSTVTAARGLSRFCDGVQGPGDTPPRAWLVTAVGSGWAGPNFALVLLRPQQNERVC